MPTQAAHRTPHHKPIWVVGWLVLLVGCGSTLEGGDRTNEPPGSDDVVDASESGEPLFQEGLQMEIIDQPDLDSDRTPTAWNVTATVSETIQSVVTISWTTEFPVDAWVEVGTTTAYELEPVHSTSTTNPRMENSSFKVLNPPPSGLGFI